MVELTHHSNQCDCAEETELFNTVQQVVVHATNPTLPHTNELRDTLLGPTITIKTLLGMRIENKVKQYLNIELDNPIKKEM